MCIRDSTDYLKTVLAALADADFAAEIVSGSGTGTHHIDLDLGVFTELQAGSYVFMDKQYCDCDLTGDGAVPFEVALGVDARVVSANHSGLVTIDAGSVSYTHLDVYKRQIRGRFRRTAASAKRTSRWESRARSATTWSPAAASASRSPARTTAFWCSRNAMASRGG